MNDAVAEGKLGHDLRQVTFNGEPITYCYHCGKWMAFRARGLKDQCIGPTAAGVAALRNIVELKRHPLKSRRAETRPEDALPSAVVASHADSHHAQVVARLVSRNVRKRGKAWHADDVKHSSAEVQPHSNSAAAEADPALDSTLPDSVPANPDASEEEEAFDFGDETSNARPISEQPRPPSDGQPSASSSPNAAAGLQPLTEELRSSIEKKRDLAKAKRRARNKPPHWQITPAPELEGVQSATSTGLPEVLRISILQRRDAARAKKARKEATVPAPPTAEDTSQDSAPAPAATTPPAPTPATDTTIAAGRCGASSLGAGPLPEDPGSDTAEERGLWAEMLAAEAAAEQARQDELAATAARQAWVDAFELQEGLNRSPVAEPPPSSVQPTASSPEVVPLTSQLRATLADLLELHLFGEPVSWPSGFDALTAQRCLASDP